ncbi:response regulator transcription factor [Paenibacillus crassostreae]|uniref:AraC family transcriptional regulator n=1 Tax=Paenibacillus crassostreae TaxID=1763538 RepID=A0A162N837_9BACL|nr:response regulator [Paenibacillus crassostreae]AOZ93688.1 DNA-binding response regulator [Paenibacillus crassostreae]OAB71382.1 AraC family transcriptional regulator [Paenibacillus crassostreae]
MGFWKVMIADDEAIIREGIKRSVDWGELGLTVVTEAEDGEEALENAIQHGIHIALVDLNMPIMHGIELMKRLREQLPDCKIVVVTGHDEFTYAQESIRLQVNDYILKPADPLQLTQIMRGLRDELEEERQKSLHLKQASKQILKNFPLLRERFCQEWLDGNLSQQEIMEQLPFLQLPQVRPELLGIIRWRTEVQNSGMKENERQLFLFAIENITLELLSDYPKAMFRDSTGLIVILLWDGASEAMLARVEQEVRTHLKIAIEVGIEAVDGGITELSTIYRRCRVNLSREAPLSPIVRRAKQYMLEHYGEYGLNLESMAGMLKTSSVYLSRLFKQEVGSSFGTYLTQIRIRKAAQLLNSTDMSINEVAERSGYETQHYFSTAFKKQTGVSPLQFRKGVLPEEDSSI